MRPCASKHTAFPQDVEPERRRLVEVETVVGQLLQHLVVRWQHRYSHLPGDSLSGRERPGDVTEQVPRGERDRVARSDASGDRPDRQPQQRRRDRVSISLFGLMAGFGLFGPSVNVGPKSKKVCQPMKRGRNSCTIDHHVLVVSRIGDDRGAVGVPRKILEESAVLDPQLGRTLVASPASGNIELLIHHWPAAVDGVEVERRRSLVGRLLGFDEHREARAEIEGHVVIQELPHECGARCVGGVVRVVQAQIGINDQGDRRCLASIAQAVPSVQEPVNLADVSHGGLQLRAVVPEEGIEVGEHAAEPVLPDDESVTGRRPTLSEGIRHARHRRHLETEKKVLRGRTIRWPYALLFLSRALR